MTPGSPAIETAAPPLASVPRLCVVLHDVAPESWQGCMRVLAQLRLVAEQAGVSLPVSLLVVPHMHGRADTPTDYLRWLHHLRRGGHEMVLHGLTHQDGSPLRGGLHDRLLRRWYTAGEGEFSAIDEGDASRRLAEARAWAQAMRLPVSGFVAPAWLMSPGAWQALAAQPLHYTCTLRHIVRLPQCERLDAPALVFSTRAAWRRQASLLWNRALARWAAAHPLLRLELHPNDADHGAVRRCWSALLLQALQQREAVTLGEASRLAWPGDVSRAEDAARKPNTARDKSYADVRGLARAAPRVATHEGPASPG